MNNFLKNFIIGGLMVAISEYFIHKDTDNIKYVSIMVHGAPLAFFATYLLLKDRKNEILLIKNGIYISSIITLLMIILYFLLNSSLSFLNNKINSTIIMMIIWGATMLCFSKYCL
jgi:hypothetical protein